MLIELGTDRLSNLKRKTFKTVQWTVAGILGLAGTYGISPNIVHAEPPAQSTGISRTISTDTDVDTITQALSVELGKIGLDLNNLGLEEPLGGILTKAWIGEDGLLRIADKKMVFKQDTDGRFKPDHMLQQLYDTVSGDLLRYGILGGDPLPELDELSAHPSPLVLSTVISLSEYFQDSYYIFSSANFGGFNVYSIRDPQGFTFALLEITEGPNLGIITLANITPQLINSGLIPKELALDLELTGIGGGIPEPIPQPTPTVLVFPRYPQIPLPSPDPSYTKRPIIRGDGECVDKTTHTLDLLREKLPTEYFLVVFHTGAIECTDLTKGKAYPASNPPYIKIPKSYLVYRLEHASTIVHESCHLWQFRRFKEMYPGVSTPPGIGGGKEAEQECYNIDYQTLKKLGESPENLKLFRDFYYQKLGIIIYNP